MKLLHALVTCMQKWLLDHVLDLQRIFDSISGCISEYGMKVSEK